MPSKREQNYTKTKALAAHDLDQAIVAICKKHGLPICGLLRGYSTFLLARDGEESFKHYFLSSII